VSKWSQKKKPNKRIYRYYRWHSKSHRPSAFPSNGGGLRHAPNPDQPAGNLAMISASGERTSPLDLLPMESPTVTHRLSTSSDQKKVDNGSIEAVGPPMASQCQSVRAVNRDPILRSAKGTYTRALMAIQCRPKTMAVHRRDLRAFRCQVGSHPRQQACPISHQGYQKTSNHLFLTEEYGEYVDRRVGQEP